jgi:DNA-binding NtrC family response regulator
MKGMKPPPAADPLPTVLLVEDDGILRRSLESILSGMGYRVLTAAGGEVAYAILESHPVDAALLDVRLPDMSGLALYHALLSRHPRLAGRVALISADLDSDDVRAWVAANHCAAFQKPFRPQVILDWLAATVASRSRQAAGE